MNRPDLPEAPFDEPWQASAFALAVSLSERGAFTRSEWATALARRIAADPGAPYYESWLAALEALSQAKGLTRPEELVERRDAWARAYHLTPHGMPVELRADDAPFHAHIYYAVDQRAAALALRGDFEADPSILLAGRMTDEKVGPHPAPQFEIHFLGRALPTVVPKIEASGLRALIHPLTDDDVADHTTLARWIGAPLELDLTTLDPPGVNQGGARFGKRDV